MTQIWIVRLGERGELADLCKKENLIAIGWSKVGDLSKIGKYEEMREQLYKAHLDHYKTPGRAGVAASILWTFSRVMNKGDIVLTPKSESREILVGKITGDYKYDKKAIDKKYPNTRSVKWIKNIPYDTFTYNLRRSLSAWQTIFEISTPEGVKEVIALTKAKGKETDTQEVTSALEEGQRLFKESSEMSFEILAKHFNTFSGFEFQEIAWAVIRATGLYPKPIRRGSDEGVDIEAYRTPLQLGPGRILVQVKHRQERATSPEIQQFLGTMTRREDVGIFISTGGFTKKAKAFAEKSNKPLSLMGWEDFVKFFLEHYEELDNRHKAKVPLGTIKILVSPKDVINEE